MADLPTDLGGGSLSRGLPPPVCGSVPGSHACPAFPLAPPDDEIGSLVLVVLRAVRPVCRFSTANVYALRNRLQMVCVHAVPPAATAIMHVVNRQPVRDRPVLSHPRLAVRIAAVAAEKPVPVAVVWPLPAQAACLRVKQGRRVVVPVLALRGRTTALGDVPALHRAVDALAVSLRDRSAARSAADVNRVSEAGGGRARGRAVDLFAAIGRRRVVRVVRASASFTVARHVLHSRHRTNGISYRTQSGVRRIGGRGHAWTVVL